MHIREFDIPKVLRKVRKRKGINQSRIAYFSSITQSELSNFENERVDMRFSTVNRIAMALDLKIIAIPKEKLYEIAAHLDIYNIEGERRCRPLTLLEKYGISDDDED